jgi:hypothetical protein
MDADDLGRIAGRQIDGIDFGCAATIAEPQPIAFGANPLRRSFEHYPAPFFARSIEY